jgi:hypothetical protein
MAKLRMQFKFMETVLPCYAQTPYDPNESVREQHYGDMQSKLEVVYGHRCSIIGLQKYD